ncbi:MAG: DNA polymerase I [Bacteroidetes bacterium 43-93]|nr:DNA polymerase I [Bacteroidota bacterium]OJW96349.1 MAG: DNA polymerase I [Bacteroidetes bacterium 43-93]
MSEKKLFLLDAMALIYRAYYALIRSPRITSTGRNTNAQFGFTTTLLDLINKEKPTHLAVVFDTHAPTERHTDFEAYKANRQEAPEDILAAIPDIKRIITGFNLPCMEKDGYEADDVIGALAHEAADLGYTVYMVTPDKDYGQLVRENIYIYKPAYQGGNVEIMGVNEVCSKWNIKRVEQVIDILGLMGDAVDNIPGIAGVGEKTAAKLLAEYDTLENVLENADKIKGALGEKVRNGKESAILSKKLATIITDVPVSFHEEDFRVKELNREKLTEVFTELEFKTLAKRVLGEEAAPVLPANGPVDLFGNPISQEAASIFQAAPPKDTLVEAAEEAVPIATHNIENTPHTYHLVDTPAGIADLVEKLMQQTEIAFDTETTDLDAHLADIIGMSFCWEKGTAYYVSIPDGRDTAINILQQFQPVFDRQDLLWIGQNIKYDLTILKWYGFELKGKIFDTMLAHYVIEPDGKRNMDILSTKYLGYEPVSIETLIGKKGKNQLSMRDVPVEQVKEYAAEDADVTLQLKHAFYPMLDKQQVRRVFEEVENPLVNVLVDMEIEGVGIDINFLRDYSKELEREIKIAEDSVYKQAGIVFNLGSPKQLGEVLFDKMRLDDKAKKTKTGQYATGEDVLNKLRNKHQIVDDILIFRELSKLKSTYVDALPTMINPRTGRVHTNFNQAIAVTGRLSSVDPNLQNIPIRTERGREIRKAFISRGEGWTLLSADYSQIELRIVAAISGDENMIQAFVDNKDIHTATAAKVYGVDEKEVTSDMRRAAKAVNFGIIYGQTAFGLSESLGISRTEAKTIIDNYFTQYSAIKRYMDNTINFAREHGYVETLMGRKRYLRDIYSANQTVRGYAERNAINSPIQGTAAEMIKLAMTRVHRELKKQNLQTRMILQVHDELVFDVPDNELEQVTKLIKENMESAMVLPHNVPINAEAGTGKNWLAAH